jgi:uncharacterized coiled-coil DUF342 family protein
VGSEESQMREDDIEYAEKAGELEKKFEEIAGNYVGKVVLAMLINQLMKFVQMGFSYERLKSTMDVIYEKIKRGEGDERG